MGYSHAVVKMSSIMTVRHMKIALGRAPCRRLESTLTVVSSPGKNSTRVHAEKKDFSTAAASSSDHVEHWNALVSAASQHDSSHTAYARDMDLVEAASCRDDKVLLLVRHGDYHQKEDEKEMDPLLSGKGVGQVLNLSRRAATFCNDETGLIPELVVTSPLRRAIQTCYLIFPQYSPAASLKNMEWICHGGLVERPNPHTRNVPLPRQELEETFPGIDFALCQDGSWMMNNHNGMVGLVESKLDLLHRADDFLQWIKERDERVILVSSHSTWLQSFCGHSLHYETGNHSFLPFSTGEMRAVGINF